VLTENIKNVGVLYYLNNGHTFRLSEYSWFCK